VSLATADATAVSLTRFLPGALRAGPRPGPARGGRDADPLAPPVSGSAVLLGCSRNVVLAPGGARARAWPSSCRRAYRQSGLTPSQTAN